MEKQKGGRWRGERQAREGEGVGQERGRKKREEGEREEGERQAREERRGREGGRYSVTLTPHTHSTHSHTLTRTHTHSTHSLHTLTRTHLVVVVQWESAVLHETQKFFFLFVVFLFFGRILSLTTRSRRFAMFYSVLDSGEVLVFLGRQFFSMFLGCRCVSNDVVVCACQQRQTSRS